MCKKQCDIETSFDCVGVECDYSDAKHCVWLRTSNCGSNEERPYSENYKTCIKIETQKTGINKDYAFHRNTYAKS